MELRGSRARRGASADHVLATQNNLAKTYRALGRHESALQMKRDVYSGQLKLKGEEHIDTLQDAFNYAVSLVGLRRFEEARSLMRRTLPVVRRVAGDSGDVSFRTRTLYAQALYMDASATLDDLREAVTTLKETEQTARRVLGGAHPLTARIEESLQDARATLRLRTE
jgi:hypothetical protein